MNIKAIVLSGIAATAISLSSMTTGLQAHEYEGYKNDSHHGHMQRKRHHGAMIKHILRHLDLSDAQKDKIKAIVDAHKPDRKQHHHQMKEVKQQMHQLLMSDDFDERQLRSLANQAADLKVDMMLERRAIMQQIKQELTDEQLEQLQEMREARKERMQERRERRANHAY